MNLTFSLKDGASSNKTAEELFESSASATYASYSLLFTEEWQRFFFFFFSFFHFFIFPFFHFVFIQM